MKRNWREKVLALKDPTTPFYYYDRDLLQETLNNCKSAADKYDFHVHYAVKANANTEVLTDICHTGLGADCVSGNEILASLEAGFKPDDVVFAGVGKSDREINIGLENNIFCFNVESVEELYVIDELAGKKGKRAKIALRLNPNVDPKTHAYITTGLEENKFGINPWEYEAIIELLPKLKNLELIGIHFHIGSQITSLEVFKNLCIRVNEIQAYFAEQNVEVKHLNLGGGLGVDYDKPDENLHPDFEKFFKVFHDFLEPLKGQQVHFELGRALVANMGSLISKVLYVKKGIKTNFAILDAGMTELLRPALYNSYHKIENLSSLSKNRVKYDVVGPICESSDAFGKAIELPETRRGDLIAIRSAGAYGEVMGSRYNLREELRSHMV